MFIYFVTLMVHFTDFFPDFTVITAFPVFNALIFPLESIFAILELELT